MMEITIGKSRYDELIRKESLLDAIARLAISKTCIDSKDVLKIIGYTPHDED